MPIYAATIFLSAFLLFQVQPLIAKIILPWFGGTAAVWSAALLFFQVWLLGGYVYAHLAIRFLSAWGQMATHVLLLAASCALLPILPSPAWKPSPAEDPTWRILGVLAATVGLPYLLLSATSPLLQAWYVRRSGSAVPYRLFALSNLGSMLGLLSFPFLVEPLLTSRQQAYAWSGAYVLFALLCAAAAWGSQRESAAAAASARAAAGRAPAGRPPLGQLFLWAALAACASTLLVAVTSHLTQNVAPIPLLWVLPLAIYLTTFILAFESDRAYRRRIFLPLLAVALGVMAFVLYAYGGNAPIAWVIPGFAIGLFVCCMVCHGELARSRPSTRHLTLFYLMISAGGALGGLFVALVAPRVFHSYLELPVGLVACALLATIVLWNVEFPRLGALSPHLAGWHRELSSLGTRPLRVALVVGVCVLAGYLARQEYLSAQWDTLRVRNFYGTLRVIDDWDTGVRILYHGTINHGAQYLDDARRDRATTYFGPNSGIGRAMRALQSRGPVRIGILGLGAGVLTSYSRQGDVYRIYEINPLVEQIAQDQFTFYARSRADKRILLGDGRLVLEGQEPQQFDLLIADAFSGDAVPVHLLTREALALYFRHLKPDGVLVLNFSNRYLDLVPVAARAAQDFHKQAMVVEDQGNRAAGLEFSTYALLTSDPEFFKAPSFATADITQAGTPARFRAWTDNYSNVVQLLKWSGRTLGGTREPPPALWEIVPGQSVGLVRLGTDLRSAIAVLGPEWSRSRPSASGTITHRWFAPPRNVGVAARTTSTGAVDRVWILNARAYATKEGLRIGSSEAQVRAAMGEPSRVTDDPAKQFRVLWYDSPGMWFSIQLDRRFVYYKKVFEIGVVPRK